MTLAGRIRQRGGFAYTQAVATLLNVPAAVRDRLLGTAGAAERRFLIEIGLAHGWWSADVVFALAVTDTDVWVRVRATDLVCRQAVWSERVDTLRRLARHPGPEVRQVALTGLLRLGHAIEVAAYLDDRAPLIRAVAREAARRADIDALALAQQYGFAWHGPVSRAWCSPRSDL